MGWPSLTPTGTVLLNDHCRVGVVVLKYVPNRGSLIPLLSSMGWTEDEF